PGTHDADFHAPLELAFALESPDQIEGALLLGEKSKTYRLAAEPVDLVARLHGEAIDDVVLNRHILSSTPSIGPPHPFFEARRSMAMPWRFQQEVSPSPKGVGPDEPVLVEYLLGDFRGFPDAGRVRATLQCEPEQLRQHAGQIVEGIDVTRNSRGFRER